MGNYFSKVREGYPEYITREVKSRNFHHMSSFQEIQAVLGVKGISHVITTPIGDRFPACACDLEYSLSTDKVIYKNIKKRHLINLMQYQEWCD